MVYNLHIEKLSKRRRELCLNFAQRTISNSTTNHTFLTKKEEEKKEEKKKKKTEFYTKKNQYKEIKKIIYSIHAIFF